VGTLSDSSSLGSRPCGQPIRRRGTKLTHAIYLATLNELAETSFEELSFDRIAIRAGAGKASLYRRWSSPKELLLEALTDPSAGFGTPRPPDTGSESSRGEHTVHPLRSPQRYHQDRADLQSL
jgi:hypothetical protein